MIIGTNYAVVDDSHVDPTRYPTLQLGDKCALDGLPARVVAYVPSGESDPRRWLDRATVRTDDGSVECDFDWVPVGGGGGFWRQWDEAYWATDRLAVEELG